MRFLIVSGAILALSLTQAAAEQKGSGAKQFAPGQQQTQPGGAKSSAPGQTQTKPGEQRGLRQASKTRQVRKKRPNQTLWQPIGGGGVLSPHPLHPSPAAQAVLLVAWCIVSRAAASFVVLRTTILRSSPALDRIHTGPCPRSRSVDRWSNRIRTRRSYD